MTRPSVRTVPWLVAGAVVGLMAGNVHRVVAQGARVAPTPPATASPYFTAEDALDISTYAVADVSADGKWIAATQSVRRDAFGNDYRRDGDPTYVHAVPERLWVIQASSGQRRAVFPDTRAMRGMRWSPDGSTLAMLLWNGESYDPAVWTRDSGKLTRFKVPAGTFVAGTSDVRWNASGSEIIVALHTAEWRQKAHDTFARITGGPVIVQSSTDPFLAWDDLRRMGNRRSVGAIDVRSGAYRELIPDATITSYELAADGRVISYVEDQTKKTEYDIGGGDGRLVARTIAGGATRTLLASTRGAAVIWAEDGQRYAYSRDGRVYVASLSDSTPRLVAGPPEPAKGVVAPAPDTSAAGRARTRILRFTASHFSPRGDALLVANGEGHWIIDLGTNSRELAIAANDSNATLPRVAYAAWSDDGSKVYFTTASRAKWERAVVRYDRATKQRDELVKDGRMYTGLRIARDGSTAVVSVADGNRPADVYAADGNLSNLRRVVESNPQLAGKRLGRTGLLSYLDADGHPKYAVMHYPADYQSGRTYPTVFIVYEEFFDDTWDVAANVLAGSGYLVVKPSVDFDIGYPGEAWLKGVTAAANKLIDMGIADSSKLGVEGTSYGGYAVNLLVEQTNRFKAAVNISGKVDLVSFYTDSPRLGVRNITAAERTQDRIGATMWQQPQKYVQHSAVLFADRIQTPLMLITGQQDSNVPEINTREMYYALRRLGKEVVWVSYANGGHGAGVASAEDFLDEQRRILEWYDTKLKNRIAMDKAATDRGR